MDKANESLRKVSTRADRLRAVQRVKDCIYTGKLIREIDLYKETGVTRVIARLKNVGVITLQSDGKLNWNTDMSTEDVVDLIWQNFGTEESEIILTPREELIGHIDSALHMAEQYGVTNKSAFIADMLIKSKIKL
jgi:hypothetical protein